MHWLCVTPERREKTTMIMQSLSSGFARTSPARLCFGEPPRDKNPFVVWGQIWLSLRIIPQAQNAHRPFWHIDNGYWNPARGSSVGYYRLTYRSMSPVMLRDPPKDRSRLVDMIKMKPWRQNGNHILLALPGSSFGQAIGIDVPSWLRTIESRLRASTDRPIRIRPKGSDRPLALDLLNAWAVVTHSSNVAVDAVLNGIPVFVAPTSPCAPVGRLDLDIEHPCIGERRHWLHSLMCQQYTLAEMRTGLAQSLMAMVANQTDAVKKEKTHGN